MNQASHIQEDWLQHRISELLHDAKSVRAVNGVDDVCVGTHVGSVRKQNEDRALIVSVSYAEAPERNFVLCALSDGIGGLPRGDDASVLTVSSFCARTIKSPNLAPETRLLAAAKGANDAVYALLKGKGGATLSAVMIVNGQALGVNVGDSRIYRIATNRKITQLTKDDTLAGYLGRGEGKASNPNENNLVQFIGMGEGIEPHIVKSIDEDVGTIIITSDGVHNAPGEAVAQIVQVAGSNLDLVQRLLTLSNVLGGRDNATAISLPENYVPPSLSQAGTSISCISPFGRLEVWLPSIESAQPKVEAAPERLDTPMQQASYASEKKAKRKKKTSRDGALPLDEDSPSLNISFPEKQKS